MPACYLHVGVHKTGSSAIQAFLGANRDALLLRGMLVPRAGLGKHGNHLPLVRALCGEPVAPKFEKAVAELTEELNHHENSDVLISTEGLEQHFRPGRPSEVTAFFQERGYRVSLVCFVRPQPARINASYAQVVKAFRHNVDFRTHVDKALEHGGLAYSRWLQIAREQSLELSALPYDVATRRDGVLSRFLRVIGLEELAPEPGAYRRNETPSAAAVAVARTCMERLAERDLHLTQRQRVRCSQALLEADREEPTPSFCGLDPALVRTIEDFYRGDNQYFASVAWERDWVDVFAAEGPTPSRSEIDRESSASPGYESYVALLDRVWPQVLGTAEDRALVEAKPWEAKTRVR